MSIDDILDLTPDKILLIEDHEERLQAIMLILLIKASTIERNIYEIEKLEKVFLETIDEIDDNKVKVESIRGFASLEGADIDRLTTIFLKSARKIEDPVVRAYELFWFLRDAHNVAPWPIIAEIKKILKEINDVEIKKEYVEFVNQVIRSKFKR